MSNLEDGSNLPDEGVQLIHIRCKRGDQPFRRMVISWNEDFKEFVWNFRRALNITEDYEMEMHSTSEIIVDNNPTIWFKPETWPSVREQGHSSNPDLPCTCDDPWSRLNVSYCISSTACDPNACQVPTYQQILTYNGRRLEAEEQLKDYGIPNGALLTIAFRLKGGGHLTDVFRRALRVIPSRPKKLLRLHYGSRRMLSLWNSNYTAFTSNARQLLGIPPERVVYFHVSLEIFGDDKMEVDPDTWPALEGSVTDVWISDTVPFPSDPAPSDIGQVHANSGAITSETQTRA